jgi:hypothetical protein
MALYFYCPRPSASAMELMGVLGATRLRRFDGIDFWNRKGRISIDPGSHLVCWGTSLANIDGIKVLNSCEKSLSKCQEYQILGGHVQVIGVVSWNAGYNLQKYVTAGYIPRLSKNSGRDLLYGVSGTPDYVTQRYAFTAEYRIHSFEGRSIRAGIKVPMEGYKVIVRPEDWKPNSNLVHPWVKTREGGWRTNYEDFHSTPEMRNLAHCAIKALGLSFGAVDIGSSTYGGLMVIGVDKAPVMNGKTLDCYVRAITRWLKGKGQEEEGVKP